MIESSKIRVLIPAAGFGKRAGSIESKEMVLNPRTGRPLIDGSLEIARRHAWPVTVITRPEKRGLLEFLGRNSGVDVVATGPTAEWPETLLRSRQYWNEFNIVLLPDTEFEPAGAEETVVWNLTRGFPLAFATFDVSDPKTWGMVVPTPETAPPSPDMPSETVVSGTAPTRSLTLICEKPGTARPNARAWGIFGFQRSVGYRLLNALLESSFDHEWKELPIASKSVELTSFRDLTRG